MAISIRSADAGADWDALRRYLESGLRSEGSSADAARACFPAARAPRDIALLRMRLLADAGTLRHRLEGRAAVQVYESDVLHPLALLLDRSQLGERTGLLTASIG